MTEARAIDAHAHYIPADILRAVAERSAELGITYAPGPGGGPPALAYEDGTRLRPFFPRLIESEEDRIAAMTRMGVGRQVVSVWTDMFGFGLPAAKATAWHRTMNDALAGLCRRHPDHFSWLASGALQEPEGAGAELRRAVREDGAVGAAAPANFAGVNLGEMSLDPYWAAVEELDVPLFVHPLELAPGPRVKRWALTQVAQYTFDTTLAIATLIFSGVLDRFPGIRLFLPHGGGALLWLSGRFDCMHGRMDPSMDNRAKHPPSWYLRRCHYDTIVHDPVLLRALVGLVGADRVLLGTDDAFPPMDRDPLATLRAAGLPEAESAAIAAGNAKALFRL
jgi:aminocarboxymuconate-semialdehyde decarboxylase